MQCSVELLHVVRKGLTGSGESTPCGCTGCRLLAYPSDSHIATTRRVHKAYKHAVFQKCEVEATSLPADMTSYDAWRKAGRAAATG